MTRKRRWRVSDRIRRLGWGGAMALALCGCENPQAESASQVVDFSPLLGFYSPPSDPDVRPVGARHFDFLHGSWLVHNRTLKERLAGSTEWEEWEASLDVIPILGGYGNLDRFRAERGGEYYEGVTVRLFDPESEVWSMSWIDNQSLRVLPQVGGAMEEWGGEFFGREPFKGDTVALRFRWSHTAADTARWEQAYQRTDGSWETNWIMVFVRRSTGG